MGQLFRFVIEGFTYGSDGGILACMRRRGTFSSLRLMIFDRILNFEGSGVSRFGVKVNLGERLLSRF